MPIEGTPLAATMKSTKTHGSPLGAALMTRSTKYVALAVHQATTLAAIRTETGPVLARTILPTEAPPSTSPSRKRPRPRGSTISSPAGAPGRRLRSSWRARSEDLSRSRA